MKKLIYDNEGETIDRYTVILFFNPEESEGDVYTMSNDPLSPQGFNQWSGRNWDWTNLKCFDKKLGEKVKFKDLPERVKKAIVKRERSYQ